MFGKRTRAQRLIAQSLYEPLSEAERADLDALISNMPDLQRESERLRAFVDRIPVEDVVFEGDLRPAVMANLSGRPGRRALLAPRWAIASAAFLVVAAGVTYRIVVDPPTAVAPGAGGGPLLESGVMAAIYDADRFAASHDYARAYARLASAVDAMPGDPSAPQACQRMAEIAFEELQWYPEAFADYDRLRQRYAEQFRSTSANFTRLNLLDETRGADNQFASLRALDGARRDANFDSLEDMAARRPATYLASAAAVEMARVAARDAGVNPAANPVGAMRAAQVRSKNPVAKTQLRLEVAHLLAASPDERDRAREMYEDIANGSITALAEAARKSLAAVDTRLPALPQL